MFCFKSGSVEILLAVAEYQDQVVGEGTNLQEDDGDADDVEPHLNGAATAADCDGAAHVWRKRTRRIVARI